MQENVHSIPGGESYTPSGFTRLLWWLATADEALVRDCKVDRSRYAVIGFTVMGTWLFATLAWTYFFSTVVDNIFIAVVLGLFMGLIILGIDRALIKGITNESKRKFLPFLLRGVLAITIGLFMAQPALLYLFNKEVHQQISLDNEQRRRDKRQQQDTLYAANRKEWQARKASLQQQLNSRYNEVKAARESFIAETDGTGGTGKVGVAAVAAAKRKEYEKLQADYLQLQQQLQPQINASDSALAAMETSIQSEQKNFEALLNDGFLTRIEALNHLIQHNTALQYRYYLLVLILLLIELMPVIAKTILPAGVYDDKLRFTEQYERSVLQAGHNTDLSLLETEASLREKYETELLQRFFETSQPEKEQHIERELQAWKNNGGRLSDYWKRIKENILTSGRY